MRNILEIVKNRLFKTPEQFTEQLTKSVLTPEINKADKALLEYANKHNDIRGEIIRALLAKNKPELMTKLWELEAMLRGTEKNPQWLGTIMRKVPELIAAYENNENYVFPFSDNVLRLLVRFDPQQQQYSRLELASNVLPIYVENWNKHFPQ